MVKASVSTHDSGLFKHLCTHSSPDVGFVGFDNNFDPQEQPLNIMGQQLIFRTTSPCYPPP